MGGGCHVTILAYASFHFQRLLKSGIFMIAVIECIKSFQMITLTFHGYESKHFKSRSSFITLTSPLNCGLDWGVSNHITSLIFYLLYFFSSSKLQGKRCISFHLQNYNCGRNVYSYRRNSFTVWYGEGFSAPYKHFLSCNVATGLL